MIQTRKSEVLDLLALRKIVKYQQFLPDRPIRKIAQCFLLLYEGDIVPRITYFTILCNPQGSQPL
jgi:hypothetical protein